MNAVVIAVVGRILVAALCMAIAGYIAADGRDGWGWFVFAAIMFGCVSASTTDEKRKP